MPRRIYTYPADMGWNTVNLITSIGSFVFALGVLIFLIDLAWSYKRGPARGDNPWDAPDARVVGSVAAAALQLRDGPVCREPPSAVGGPASEDEGRALGPRSMKATFSIMAARHSARRRSTANRDIILKMPERLVCAVLARRFSVRCCLSRMLLHAWWFTAAMLAAHAVSLIAWLWPERALMQREPDPYTMREAQLAEHRRIRHEPCTADRQRGQAIRAAGGACGR